MVTVQLIIDLFTPGVGRRRAERIVSLPGVPAVGDWIDTTPRAMVALTITGVRWRADGGTPLLFLGTHTRPGITDHDGELELADYIVEDLASAGWTIGEYE